MKVTTMFLMLAMSCHRVNMEADDCTWTFNFEIICGLQKSVEHRVPLTQESKSYASRHKVRLLVFSRTGSGAAHHATHTHIEQPTESVTYGGIRPLITVFRDAVTPCRPPSSSDADFKCTLVLWTYSLPPRTASTH